MLSVVPTNGMYTYGMHTYGMYTYEYEYFLWFFFPIFLRLFLWIFYLLTFASFRIGVPSILFLLDLKYTWRTCCGKVYVWKNRLKIIQSWAKHFLRNYVCTNKFEKLMTVIRQNFIRLKAYSVCKKWPLQSIKLATASVIYVGQ